MTIYNFKLLAFGRCSCYLNLNLNIKCRHSVSSRSINQPGIGQPLDVRPTQFPVRSGDTRFGLEYYGSVHLVWTSWQQYTPTFHPPHLLMRRLNNIFNKEKISINNQVFRLIKEGPFHWLSTHTSKQSTSIDNNPSQSEGNVLHLIIYKRSFFLSLVAKSFPLKFIELKWSYF